MNTIRFGQECQEFELQAFYKALKGGDLGKVKEIYRRNGDDILLRKFRINSQEMTPLEIAAENGHENIILLMTDDCADILDKDYLKKALLRCASSTEKTANDGMACLLANVKYTDDDLNDAIKNCTQKNKRELLLNYGAKPSPTCILDVIEADDLTTLKKYIQVGHASLEMTFNFGADTMLSMSAMYQARKVFSFLIDQGMSPECKMNGYSVMDRLPNYDRDFQVFARKTWDGRKKFLIDTAGIIREDIANDGAVKVRRQRTVLRL